MGRWSPDARSIRRRLLAWFARERRDLPWRHDREPWRVLVSEVMLQQTQAARVAERFGAFMDRFPTPRAMADATPAAALAAWSGLGYNRRAVALQRTAREVATDGWPVDVAGLEGLPGIGPYTARAVAAIAFGQPVGAVDTNVRRWLVRRYGLADEVPRAELQRLADALAAADGPATTDLEAASWMHASMEFGAQICSARRPRCDACPIAAGCPSRNTDRHVPVTRQAAFAGSPRAARGALIRSLAAAAGHRLALDELPDDQRAVVAALAEEGLLHEAAGSIHLGGAPEGAAATEIAATAEIAATEAAPSTIRA
jgi:A/G-specific adenine glycosylase